jgi:hypothetical protein
MGENSNGTVSNCYSNGLVQGTGRDSWLMAYNRGVVIHCFWDIQTSGQANSAGGTGKTTVEMKTLSTFTDAGWDFVGETENGTEDTWRMCVNGLYYPRLNWEFSQYADFICPDGVGLEDFSYLAQFWMVPEGDNTPADPDKNNAVGISDLMVFCQQWLNGR